MRSVRFVLGAIASAVVFQVAVAEAAIITVVVDTNVSDDPLAIVGPDAAAFTPGERVRITYSFDDTLPDLDPNVGDGEFTNLTQLDVEFLDSGLSFLFGGTAGTFVTTDDDVGGSMDAVGMSSFTRLGGEAMLGGRTVAAIAVGLNADGSPLVVNDALAPGPFSILFGSVTVRTGALGLFGTSMLLQAATVPEPGAAALIAMGLLVAAGARRRA